jgi:hypothetical protein
MRHQLCNGVIGRRGPNANQKSDVAARRRAGQRPRAYFEVALDTSTHLLAHQHWEQGTQQQQHHLGV